MPKMTEIRPIEVSLVDRPANKRDFLTLKSQGESTMEDILELIQKTEAENEEELVDALEEAGLSEDAVKAATVIARATSGTRDELTAEDFISIGKAVGYDLEVVDEAEADAEEDEDTSRIDKSQLTPEAREYLDSLEDRVEKMEQSSALDGFIEKAEDNYSNLTASSEELGAVLMDAHKSMDEDNVAILERVLKSSNERVAEDGEGVELEAEKGTSEPGDAGNAEDAFFAKRDAILDENDDLTKPQATLKTAKEHPELYAEYKRQQNA